MKFKLMTAGLFAVATLAACTTRPVTINTPGPGESTVQVPVPANANMKLTDDVRAALDKAMNTDAAGIEVKVDGSTVYLTGHVPTQAQHDQAIAVAQGTPKVATVIHSGLLVD